MNKIDQNVQRKIKKAGKETIAHRARTPFSVGDLVTCGLLQHASHSSLQVGWALLIVSLQAPIQFIQNTPSWLKYCSLLNG